VATCLGGDIMAKSGWSLSCFADRHPTSNLSNYKHRTVANSCVLDSIRTEHYSSCDLFYSSAPSKKDIDFAMDRPRTPKNDRQGSTRNLSPPTPEVVRRTVRRHPAVLLMVECISCAHLALCLGRRPSSIKSNTQSTGL
jgi:hypothetical protein